MSETIERAIRFSGQSGNHTPATMRSTRYSRKERQLQALKGLASMWVLALLGLLIPIAHFVLVPGFFIAGIVIAYKKTTIGEEDAESADGNCPTCGNAISIKPDRDGSLPQWRYCPECSEPIELQAASEQEAPSGADSNAAGGAITT